MRSKILNVEYRPGSIIFENAITKELNLSRTPVREVLKKLEMEGLIITLPFKRKQVFMLTIKDIEKIFYIKKSLESSIARWAAGRGKEEDFRKLKEIVEEMVKIAENKITNIDDKNYEKWLEKDNEFHNLLFKMADNDKAEQIIS